MGGVDRLGMADRWFAGGHGSRDPMERMRARVNSDITGQLDALPGRGTRREDVIALLSTFILVAAQQLAIVTDRARAAAALRRLADIVERGQLDGVAS